VNKLKSVRAGFNELTPVEQEVSSALRFTISFDELTNLQTEEAEP